MLSTGSSRFRHQPCGRAPTRCPRSARRSRGPSSRSPGPGTDGGAIRDGVGHRAGPAAARQPLRQAGHRRDGGARAGADGIASLKIRYKTASFGYYIDSVRSRSLHAVRPTTAGSRPNRGRGAVSSPVGQGSTRRRCSAPDERDPRAGRRRSSESASDPGRRRGAAHPGAPGPWRRWTCSPPLADHAVDAQPTSSRTCTTATISSSSTGAIRWSSATAPTRSCRTTLCSTRHPTSCHPHRPNMGGKSTFLRQTALISLLAQIGSFVPAREAKVGARGPDLRPRGASDNIARGQSTFMVEMQETATSSTPPPRAAWSSSTRSAAAPPPSNGLQPWHGPVAEHLPPAPARVRRPVFATHYHEADGPPLTAGPRRRQLSRGWRGGVARRDSCSSQVVPGRSDRSYGIRRARLCVSVLPLKSRGPAGAPTILKRRSSGTP